INQFVEIDLHEFTSVKEWKSFIREKYVNYNFLSNQSDKFRFDKFLELEESQSTESPKQYFFEYIRRNPNLNYINNLHFTLGKIYEDFLFKSSKNLQNNEITETLRVLTKIFYRIKNCDTLEGFCNYFKTFKNQGIIHTNLSLRGFSKNLRWINKYSYITPTYYFDWKALNIAYLACYLKFNPLLEKAQIDKIINQMPFLIMPNLSITNFTVELSAYFVIPEIYIEDLKYMLEKMERNGYVTKKICSLAKKYVFSLNLNYFRDFHKNGQIINYNNKNHSNDYELEFIQNYSKKFSKANLTLLDFLILDRIRFFSYVGINFSRRREISNIIKSDYNNFFSGENGLTKELENCLEVLINSPKLREDFLNFLGRNQNFGFFYIKDELEKWVNYSQIIERESKHTINDFIHFKEFYEKEHTLQLIEEDGVFDIIDSNSYSFKNLFLNYLNSREKYTREVENFRFFFQFLKLCSNLKIFNIKSIKRIISNLELLKEITQIKKARLRDLKKNNKIYEISNKTINLRINELINNNPKIIKPYLIDSIWTNSISSYFPQLILKNSPEVKAIIDKIKKWFPKIYFYETTDLFNEQEYIFLHLFIPYLKNNEKIMFISILSNIFKKDIISFNRYSWNGLLQTFSRKNFYDFNKRAFFYTKDLFKQYFLYIKGILGEELKPFKEKTVSSVRFWSKKEYMKNLINKINNRKKDWIHKITHLLSEHFDCIILEDLNIKGMQQFNSGLSKSVTLDFSWNQFNNILRYKMEQKGKYLILIDRFFPSSKMCSVCGYINNQLKLKDRKWSCPACSTEHDRDINASINIRNKGLENLKENQIKIINNNDTTVGTTGFAFGENVRLINQQFSRKKEATCL
ncbi:MAG: transposase, partial [Candidatus Lokiarchaeota archaeon]|nr:transposase [Candidatus Lokiarchaeota archaeon]